MTPKEKRKLRIQILRERYHYCAANNWEEKKKLIDENENIKIRISNYLTYKKSTEGAGKEELPGKIQ